MARKYTGDLNRAVAERTGIDEEEIRRILWNAFDQLETWVAKGHEVQITGFGTIGKGLIEFRPGASLERALEE